MHIVLVVSVFTVLIGIFSKINMFELELVLIDKTFLQHCSVGCYRCIKTNITLCYVFLDIIKLDPISKIKSNNWTHNKCDIAAGSSNILLTSARWNVTANFVNFLSKHVADGERFPIALCFSHGSAKIVYPLSCSMMVTMV